MLCGAASLRDGRLLLTCKDLRKQFVQDRFWMNPGIFSKLAKSAREERDERGRA